MPSALPCKTQHLHDFEKFLSATEWIFLKSKQFCTWLSQQFSDILLNSSYLQISVNLESKWLGLLILYKETHNRHDQAALIRRIMRETYTSFKLDKEN